MDKKTPSIHNNMKTVDMIARFQVGDVSETQINNVASILDLQLGDLDKGFKEADIIIEREFETGTYHQGYIESHNGTAQWNENDEITVWLSTQGAFNARDQLAALLQVPMSKIKVIPMEIGGGFGGKIPMYMEPLAAIMSKQTGKPVKMHMQRDEVLLATGPTSATYIKVKVGAKNDGTIVAADAYLAYEAGAYPGSPVSGGGVSMFMPYAIPNVRALCLDVIVNKTKTAAYRAPGVPAAAFAIESIIDELAEKLEIDPITIRMHNAAEEGTRRHDGVLAPSMAVKELLEEAQATEHWNAELSDPSIGRGIAIGAWGNGGMESSAYASINSDGTINLNTGSVDIGGQRASLAMQLAETLGIEYDSIKPQVVDTDSIGYTAVSAGSRTTFATGIAVIEVGNKLKEQIIDRVATFWEINANALEYNDDGSVSGPDKIINFKEIAAMLPNTGGRIQASIDIQATTHVPTIACHIVDVKVDEETGKVDILRSTALQDVGKAIHPSYVEGQTQGGILQGIGMALYEEYYYDDKGILKNASLLDYRMPTSYDVPFTETILVEKPNPGHPFGVKGVGEVPIVPPLAAVANAIYDAVGVRPNVLPVNPRRLSILLKEKTNK
jgi:CO/xanthine dehydrogenase Mo-binding subunit